MTRKVLIYQMFLTQYNILTAEIDELQRRLRYSRATTIDCLELSIAIERLDMLKEMQRYIFQVLSIDEEKELDRLFKEFEKEQADKIKF